MDCDNRTDREDDSELSNSNSSFSADSDSSCSFSDSSSESDSDLSDQSLNSQSTSMIGQSPEFSLLACFLRHNLLASASKDIIITFKQIFPHAASLQDLNYDDIWKSVTNTATDTKEYHYCTL